MTELLHCLLCVSKLFGAARELAVLGITRVLFELQVEGPSGSGSARSHAGCAMMPALGFRGVRALHESARTHHYL